ncbi:type IV secretory system conjugative DNA transfer family protein [Streptomyces sp. NPDC090075]|uniref:type IV secretory system conjugative DNA transfer family protein n=1 Tax=Streptomyces sp. NPDC090075 TaxID=3365937 RepID=UPI003812A201
MDDSHKTYELIFPPGLNLAAAARMFTALVSLLDPIYRGPLVVARRSIFFDLLFTETGPHHLMSVPADITEAVRKHLRAVMPMLRMTEVAAQPREWRIAGNLLLTQAEPEDATKEATKDAAYIPVVLSSMTGMTADDAALTRLIVSGGGGGRLLYSAQVATTAAHPMRARQIMRALDKALRSVHAVITRPVPAGIINRTILRGTPVFEWHPAPSAETLALGYVMPIGGPQVAGMKYNRGRYFAPDPTIPRDGLVVAEANYVGAERPLAMTPVGRASHTLVVGPNGSGKSTLLETMMEADIKDGGGFAYIDPKGDSVARVLDMIPRHRIQDVILFDVTDLDYPIGFNLLEGDRSDRIAGQLVLAFDKLFDLSSTPRAIDVLRSTLMSLAEVGHTIIDVPLILEAGPRGQPFRDRVAAQLTSRELVGFWVWYENLTPREQAEVAAPITRRLRPMSIYPELRSTFGQSVSGFNLRDAVRQGKIILVPLQSAQLHEEAKLVGTLFLNGLWNEIRTAGLTQNFPLYVDEFREVSNLPVSYGQLFEQARGYRMPIIAATQDIGRFKEQDRKDLTNNTRNKFTFQPAVTDARLIAAEMGSDVTEDDVMNLGPRELMMRFLVEGAATPPVTGRAYPPPTPVGLGNAARAASRTMNGRPRAEVEAEIERRHAGSRTAPRAVVTPPDEPSSEAPALGPIGWEPWDGSLEE